ncbi:YkgJ family cysteine cluster protein [bacterium]|nr:YkgJ family cysteine cluster protein [bacterium]
MTDSISVKDSYPEPHRLSFPLEETRIKWLPMLLDTYFIADKGVHEGIGRQLKKGRKLACAKGCSTCCRAHTKIPVYPLELTGLYWYITDKTQGDLRSKLRVSLENHGKGDPCPMLIEGTCAVHPMRPQACRHFNVFDKVCEEGEDAYYTRREDVLTPIKRSRDEALSNMLPFHKITSRSQRREAMKTGLIHSHAHVLQEVEWALLSKRMID